MKLFSWFAKPKPTPITDVFDDAYLARRWAAEDLYTEAMLRLIERKRRADRKRKIRTYHLKRRNR